MDIGLSTPLKDYGSTFPRFAPVVPSFSRIFVPPRGRMPRFDAPQIANLPAGTLPWISHKDQLPITLVSATWSAMPPPPAGRRYRWSYFHESAPLVTRQARDSWATYWRSLVSMHADHERSADIELVNIQTAYAIRFRSDVDYRDYVIPGITYGLDCYPRMFGNGYEPPESLFAMGQAVAREFEVPWCVPELGAELRPPNNRAEWFRESLDYLRATDCTAVGLWCSSENRAGTFYDYRPDPATFEIWKAAMAT